MKKWYAVAAVLVVVILGLVYFSQRQTGMVVDSELVAINGHTDLTAVEAKMMIDEGTDFIIVDVSPFYEKGHLPGAIWAYFGDGSLDRMIPHFNPEMTYLVYCHFDGPSIKSVKRMSDAGFDNVYRLSDHYSGWVEAGYPVEK